MSFSRVHAAVTAFCGDADVAFEATQEAFARAYARWPHVKKTASPKAWVTTTAFNIARRRFRKVRRDTGSSDVGVISGPTAARVDLLAALRALPNRQRQAVVLHYLVDCPIATVADLMGLSEGSVKSHLYKARAALRNSLEVHHA